MIYGNALTRWIENLAQLGHCHLHFGPIRKRQRFFAGLRAECSCKSRYAFDRGAVD
jgi:hypothetical protein